MSFHFFKTKPPVNDQFKTIMSKLLAYCGWSYSFWQGWFRHHNEFIQSLLEDKELSTVEQIRQKFIEYVQLQHASIDMEGDFAKICRYLKVEIPDEAKKRPYLLSTLLEYTAPLQQVLTYEPQNIGVYPIGF
ncbi:MAG: hypothetical protein EPN84_06080 [Legionella sp.]|nr:MAG: hypothetical protein EPN84_06080 [Legionella sp.]